MNSTTLAILSIAGFVAMMSFSIPQTAAVGQGVKICEQIADSNCLVNFRWDPADHSTDPKNLDTMNGVFQNIGLFSERTSNVKGEIERMLVGQPKIQFEKTISSTSGTTTITTTVASQQRAFNDITGQVTIDNVLHNFHLKVTGYDVIQLIVDEEVELLLLQGQLIKKNSQLTGLSQCAILTTNAILDLGQ